MISIDMPAGPSEVLVIADRYASPVHIAADLLSQVLSLFPFSCIYSYSWYGWHIYFICIWKAEESKIIPPPPREIKQDKLIYQNALSYTLNFILYYAI